MCFDQLTAFRHVSSSAGCRLTCAAVVLFLSFVWQTGGRNAWSANERSSDEPILALSTDPADIEARVQQLPPEQREKLRHKRIRFERLSPAEQKRLRELHMAIATDPESERLYQVLMRYQQWLKALPSGERAKLVSLEPAERIAHIRKLRQQQEQQRVADYDEELIGRDGFRALREWLANDYMAKHGQAAIDSLPSEDRARFGGEGATFRRGGALMHEFISHGSKITFPSPSPEALDRLYTKLPKEAAERLSEAGDEQQQLERLRELMRARMRSYMRSSPWFPNMPVSQEELTAFYEETLSDTEREQLERLPAEDMRSRLRGEYFEHKFRRRGSPDRRGGPGGPGGQGGPTRGDGRRGPGPLRDGGRRERPSREEGRPDSPPPRPPGDDSPPRPESNRPPPRPSEDGS